MINKVLRLTLPLILVLTFIVSFVLPEATLADKGETPSGIPSGVPSGKPEVLGQGKYRLSPNTVVTLAGEQTIGGKKHKVYQAEVDTLPTTLEDNKTLIDTNWYLMVDNSGQTWFETGVNLFKARVLNGRVSIEDENGHLIVWDPSISIGGKAFSGGEAQIVDDPLNEYYKGNCLRWDYGSYSNGWWIFGSSAPVQRYLRVIEGYISELWIIPIDPKADVYVNLNGEGEEGFAGDTTWLAACDADCNPLEIGRTKTGVFVIKASEFKGKTFPVTIDPTTNFIVDAADGFAYSSGDSYSAARTATSATYESFAGTTTTLGQLQDIDGWYTIYRNYLYFNTSSLPSNATITASTLYLYGYGGHPDTNFLIYVQSGMPTYPHNPWVSTDFNYSYYSGNGGSLYTVGWSTSGYNLLTLGYIGESWINKVGWTKFCLRSSGDISGSEPGLACWDCVQFYNREKGTTYTPKLRVIYTIPAEVPTVTTNQPQDKTETSVKFVGTLTNDGGEPCSVRFQYDTSTAYAYATDWVSGYTTGMQFSEVVYGLTPGELYYFRAQASNSGGTGTGSGVAFITFPHKPSVFTATDGNDLVALTWTKGTGAQKTMIRKAVDTYPATPTSGTQVYFDTGTNHDDESVEAGTTYYYSAWSYATEGGYSEYSVEKAMDYGTPYSLGDPVVTTNDATEVESTTATLNMNLDNLGGYATTNVWFQWGLTDAYGETTGSTEKTVPGPHSAGISELTPDTPYHFRAVGQNAHGTSYGADETFTTGGISAPTMTTQAATGVQLFSATLNGKVTDSGGGLCTVWFQYGLTTSYGSSTPTVVGLTTDDVFYYGLGNLTHSTLYHYRAVGQNDGGIGYGADQEFTTATPVAPTAQTNDALSVGANQATLRGTLVADGGVPCEVRFQYSTTGEYGGEEVNTSWLQDYTAGLPFGQLITGLAIGETYHFRAQAKNAGGTGSGEDETFTTVFVAPVSFRARAISSTTINIEWTKGGDQTYIRYEVGGFPIDRLDGMLVYFGPDTKASLSGLLMGTTYYFKAWSWREGDVWADEYAEDVATTPASTPGEEAERPDVVDVPPQPTGWFQVPSGTALSQLPLYDQVGALATSYGMPPGILWMLIGLALTAVASVVAYGRTRGLAIAVVAGAVAILVCSALGMMPLWFLIIWFIMSGGLMFIMLRI